MYRYIQSAHSDMPLVYVTGIYVTQNFLVNINLVNLENVYHLLYRKHQHNKLVQYHVKPHNPMQGLITPDKRSQQSDICSVLTSQCHVANKFTCLPGGLTNFPSL